MRASVWNNMLACIFCMKSTTFRDVRESFATLSSEGCPSPRCLESDLVFYDSPFPHQERLTEGSEVKIERLSSLPLHEERSAVTTSLQNLTNFRSTSTSTSFSREAAAMQNEKRQTRQRTFSSLLLKLVN